MKEQILKIAKDLLLGLFGVSGSLPYKTFQNITQFSGNCFILLVIAS
jgi:hypothetical protein